MLRSFIAPLRDALARLVGSFRRSSRDERLDEEVRFHIEMHTERNRRLGLPEDEARRAALVSFGGREPWKEASRDEYRSRPLEDFVSDARHAARTLAASPGFTAAAVLTLALGIGASTAIFSAVDGVLLKPLPFARSEQIVRLYQNDRKKGRDFDEVAPGNFADWRARSTAFSAMAAIEPFGYVYSGPQGEEQIRAWNVTQDFFPVLDAKPMLGRVFEPGDFVAGPVTTLVITYASWQTRWGADPNIVGKKITIASGPATIVGVLPRDFSYLAERTPQEMYAPKVLDTIELRLRGSGWYNAVARLKPGVTVSQASADLNRVATQLGVEFPKANGNLGATVVLLRDGIIGRSVRPLYLLLGAVGCLLLIACTNVANLMLARTNRRGREFAIRVAIGAGRWRIVRQLLTESFLIAVTGGVGGALLARWGVAAIRALSPMSLPRVDEMGVDGRALAFTLAAVVLTTFAFGLLPALRAAAPASQGELAAAGRAIGGRRQHRARDVLVAVEVALAALMLIGAGLLGRSFVLLINQDRGYRSDHLLTASVFIWQSEPTRAGRSAFVRRMVDRASHLPGVISAGATSSLPLGGAIGAEVTQFNVVGQPTPLGQEPTTRVTSLTPSAFETMGVVLHRGRLFAATDDSANAQVAVINETMARRYFPAGDAIGKRLTIGFYDKPIEREVVGIVGDIRQLSLDAAPDPMVYLPHAQASSGSLFLLLRTSLDPTALSRDVKRLVAELNPALPVATMASADTYVSDSLKPRRFTLLLLTAFSVGALLLAIIGVYGVVSHGTAERSRELGVRIALGATPVDIVSMVMRQGLGSAAVGVVVGVAIAAVLSRLLSSMLYAVSPLDVLTFGFVGALMLATAAAACYVPARRATRADPLVALREG